jgi:hypothetical protein
MEKPFIVLTLGLGFTVRGQSVNVGDIAREDDLGRLLFIEELTDFALPLRALRWDVDVV